MKVIFIIAMTLNVSIHAALAQNVAINNDGSLPHPSAILDIKSTDRGLLIPRISLVSDSDIATISSPRLSLLIYNTNTSLPYGDGFYFWNGNLWSKLATRVNLDNLAWGIGGNKGTNANTDFIGTTDNRALVFKTNNMLSGKIDPGPNNVFFGQSAGAVVTNGINNSFFGHQAGASTTNGNTNTAIGVKALFNNVLADANVAVGFSSLFSNTDGAFNTATGNSALYSNFTGSDNVANGYNALYANTTGSYNVANGYQALYSNTHGSGNVANGRFALRHNTSGFSNVADGDYTLFANTTGFNNVAVGAYALYSDTSGSYNVAAGRQALYSNTSGLNNIATGFQSLFSNTNGDGNIGIGFKALFSNTTGFENTALGSSANVLSGSLTNATVIGSNAGVSTSNTMAFGDSMVEHWSFGITTTKSTFAIEVGSNSTNGNGAYLTTGGTWVNACDINKKEDFSEVNGDDLLNKISQLSVTKWKYKATNEYHIGPVAQQFYQLFKVGLDDKGISTVDAAGIALVAIQELKRKIENQNELILLLQKRIDAVEKK